MVLVCLVILSPERRLVVTVDVLWSSFSDSGTLSSFRTCRVRGFACFQLDRLCSGFFLSGLVTGGRMVVWARAGLRVKPVLLDFFYLAE